MNVKQVIITRKDLNMRKGKIVSQASHASMAAVICPDNYVVDGEKADGYHFEASYVENGIIKEEVLVTHMVDECLKYWLQNSFAKISLFVNSEEELLKLRDEAAAKNMRHSLIEDNGKTEFGGVKTNTCLAIGPHLSEDIDKMTGHLGLL